MKCPPRIPPFTYERHAGAATAPLGCDYRRREPEKTVVHAVVREHLAGFLDAAREADGEGYPRFIEHEFERYLSCGVLARGFAVRGARPADSSGWSVLPATADLVDHRLPVAPYHQWVLTFPWVLRFRLAVDRPLFAALIRGYLHTLLAWQRRRGSVRGSHAG